jgi:hypothetical protein
VQEEGGEVFPVGEDLSQLEIIPPQRPSLRIDGLAKNVHEGEHAGPDWRALQLMYDQGVE